MGIRNSGFVGICHPYIGGYNQGAYDGVADKSFCVLAPPRTRIFPQIAQITHIFP